MPVVACCCIGVEQTQIIALLPKTDEIEIYFVCFSHSHHFGSIGENYQLILVNVAPRSFYQCALQIVLLLTKLQIENKITANEKISASLSFFIKYFPKAFTAMIQSCFKTFKSNLFLIVTLKV